MQTIHLEHKDETAQRFNAATFRYSGQKFKARIHDQGGMELRSYWDGGSRSDYIIVKLEDMSTLPIPENGSGFTPDLPALPLPAPGFAVVEHSIFCGKDMGLTIHLHAENAAKLVSAPSELTWEQRVVLVATRSLKSSHNGRTRLSEAMEDTGITAEQYEIAKSALIASGHLNKAGAITPQGRNAAGDYSVSLMGLGKERGYDRFARRISA